MKRPLVDQAAAPRKRPFCPPIASKAHQGDTAGAQPTPPATRLSKASSDVKLHFRSPVTASAVRPAPAATIAPPPVLTRYKGVNPAVKGVFAQGVQGRPLSAAGKQQAGVPNRLEGPCPSQPPTLRCPAPLGHKVVAVQLTAQRLSTKGVAPTLSASSSGAAALQQKQPAASSTAPQGCANTSPALITSSAIADKCRSNGLSTAATEVARTGQQVEEGCVAAGRPAVECEPDAGGTKHTTAGAAHEAAALVEDSHGADEADPTKGVGSAPRNVDGVRGCPDGAVDNVSMVPGAQFPIPSEAHPQEHFAGTALPAPSPPGRGTAPPACPSVVSKLPQAHLVSPSPGPPNAVDGDGSQSSHGSEMHEPLNLSVLLEHVPAPSWAGPPPPLKATGGDGPHANEATSWGTGSAGAGSNAVVAAAAQPVAVQRLPTVLTPPAVSRSWAPAAPFSQLMGGMHVPRLLMALPGPDTGGPRLASMEVARSMQSQLRPSPITAAASSEQGGSVATSLGCTPQLSGSASTGGYRSAPYLEAGLLRAMRGARHNVLQNFSLPGRNVDKLIAASSRLLTTFKYEDGSSEEEPSGQQAAPEAAAAAGEAPLLHASSSPPLSGICSQGEAMATSAYPYQDEHEGSGQQVELDVPEALVDGLEVADDCDELLSWSGLSARFLVDIFN